MRGRDFSLTGKGPFAVAELVRVWTRLRTERYGVVSRLQVSSWGAAKGGKRKI